MLLPTPDVGLTKCDLGKVLQKFQMWEWVFSVLCPLGPFFAKRSFGNVKS